MDTALGNRLIELRARIVGGFDAGSWEEVGLLTGATEVITRHPRLLRSLSWGDEDYAGNVLTVRETGKVLDQIERVIQDYDVARPMLRLHFKLFSRRLAGDSGLADMEPVLRSALVWPGYHLTTEAVMSGTVGARELQQLMGDGNLSYNIVVGIAEVQPGESIRLDLVLDDVDAGYETALRLPATTVPLGRWSVLGTPMNLVRSDSGELLSTGQHARILVVHPDYILP